MNDLQAVELRHSRRSYAETPIENEKKRILQELIIRLNKQSGLSIQFIENGKEAFQGFNPGYGLFHGVRSYFAIVGKTSDIHLYEKAGYYGEQLVLQAVKLGLGTCWVGGSFNRKHCTCTVHEDETLLIVITVGNVEENRSFKENTINRLTHRKSKSAEELAASDTDLPDWFLAGIKAVQRAPSAVNKLPVLFRYEKGIVTAERTGSTDYQLIDLGIAKLHFEIGAGNGRFELGNGAKMVVA